MARRRCHELNQEALLECEGTMSLQVQLAFVGLPLKQQANVRSWHKSLAVPRIIDHYLLIKLDATAKCRLCAKESTGAQQLAASLMHWCALTLKLKQACEQHQQHCESNYWTRRQPA